MQMNFAGLGCAHVGSYAPQPRFEIQSPDLK